MSPLKYQWNCINADTVGTIKCVGINRVLVLSRVILGFNNAGTVETVHNNEVSVLSGCP